MLPLMELNLSRAETAMEPLNGQGGNFFSEILLCYLAISYCVLKLLWCIGTHME